MYMYTYHINLEYNVTKKDIPESIASFISIFNALHAELDAYSGNFC